MRGPGGVRLDHARAPLRGLDRAGRRTFAALAVPNFRRYFAGQSISLVGTWMQTVAQSWLVLQLSGSPTVLGLVVAAQFLPVLLVGAYGGVLADRYDKRRLMMVTQSTMALLALGLGLLTQAHLIRLWMVVAFALALGIVNALDNPARQTLVPEMVPPAMLQNAVSLNSVMVNAARAVGPAAAGILIASVGVGVCFLANSASYGAVLWALHRLRTGELRQARAVARGRGQLRDGLRYVRGRAALWVPLAMMALIGTMAYEFQVVLPVLATTGLGGGAREYGFLTAAMGGGAIVGGLLVAAVGRAGTVPLITAAAGFGAVMLLAALPMPLPAVLAAVAAIGLVSTIFLATANTTLQLTSDPSYRGRVMSLWAVTFLGSTPIGGPIVGAIAEHLGPRVGLAAGALSCLVAAGLGVLMLPRIPAAARFSRAAGAAGAAAVTTVADGRRYGGSPSG